jgi:AcrR family transcriptional regulator
MASVTSRPEGTARRKPAGQRRAEITETAAAIAVSEGLDKVTAKRVADALGVFPGLVSHYFATADELVAAAFAHAAAGERAEVFGSAEQAGPPPEQLRALLGAWLHPDRDPVSLLWLDAWQAGRRRPALLADVVRQMNADADRLAAVIEAGVAAGDFTSGDARATATQILSLVDGLSVQAAVRAALDYAAVRAMVVSTAERLLGLPPGALALGGPRSPARRREARAAAR